MNMFLPTLGKTVRQIKNCQLSKRMRTPASSLFSRRRTKKQRQGVTRSRIGYRRSLLWANFESGDRVFFFDRWTEWSLTS